MSPSIDMAEAGPSRLSGSEAQAEDRVRHASHGGENGKASAVTTISHPLSQAAAENEEPDEDAREKKRQGTAPSTVENAAQASIREHAGEANVQEGSSVVDLQILLQTMRDTSEAEARRRQESTAQGQQSDQLASNSNNETQNEALMVRRNMLRTSRESFSLLTRWSRIIFIGRLAIGLAQVVLGIAIMSLPSSLGDSASTSEICDPEAMFVFLLLHTIRVFVALPIDFYLGLSPHRTSRGRRPDSPGFADRERNRRMGTLQLDRRIGGVSDLLGFVHFVLFIYGNYTVWTNTACSHSPADSVPLFFTCIAILSITYFIIFELALIFFLVIFFLPLLIAILSALGLSHRLPQRNIHPETAKITQVDIEKHSKLVYYSPEEDVADDGRGEHDADACEESSQRQALGNECQHSKGLMDTATTPANESGEATSHVPKAEDIEGNADIEVATCIEDEKSSKRGSSHADAKKQPQKLLRLFGFGRRERRKSSASVGDNLKQESKTGSSNALRYPLYKIPTHRATCPICLCDYEEVDATTTQRRTEAGDPLSPEPTPANEQERQEPEPLRLLECGHAMHRSCVDQWLLTVSGRCPVCQRPLLEPNKVPENGANGNA